MAESQLDKKGTHYQEIFPAQKLDRQAQYILHILDTRSGATGYSWPQSLPIPSDRPPYRPITLLPVSPFLVPPQKKKHTSTS